MQFANNAFGGENSANQDEHVNAACLESETVRTGGL